MENDNKMVKVTNRSRGTVGYTIPDMGNLQRFFAHGETKVIPMEEIRKLDWTPGGAVLLRDYLKIEDADAVEEILHDVEPEYNYTEADIKEILLNGSMDQLMDTLDFAPEGVIDLVKDLAIKLEIPDVRKRNAISERTKCDISKAIEINNLSKESNDELNESGAKQRRVQPISTSTGKERRVSVLNDDKYKIIR